jgi:hypothetical protein
MSFATDVSWKFTACVAPERSARLLSWESFDEIVESLSNCEISDLYWEGAMSPHLKGCSRASFELLVPADVYDGFFNSPMGYRGQFARSETHGELANRKVLDALLYRLLDAAATHQTANLHQITTSLQAKQAKIWIVETTVEDQLTDPSPSIVFPPWEFNEPNGQGLRAPRGTHLEVKGGWVSPVGDEVINQFKNDRSRHINRTGDSK